MKSLRYLFVSLLSYLATACTLTHPWPECDNTTKKSLAYSPPPALEILETAWTNEVGVDRNPQRRYYYLAPLFQPLFFWTKLQGKGKFIWHVWYHDGQLVNQVPLEIGNSRWRTWSKKELNTESSRGTWEVKLLYSDMTPILCGAQVCSYKIQVQ